MRKCSKLSRLYAKKERAFSAFDRAIGTPREAKAHARFVEARRQYEAALCRTPPQRPTI